MPCPIGPEAWYTIGVMPKQWEAWSEAEEQKLLLLRADGKPIKEICRELKRPLSSVAHKAMRLNAGVDRHYRHFTKVDKRRLQRLYATAPWSELEAAFPGRSRPVISQAAQRFGIKRDRSRESIADVDRVMALPETDIAYFAGFIDGEGSILRRSNGQVVISLGNTSKRAIDWMLSKVGGRAYWYPPNGMGTKPIWRWHLSRSRVAAALLQRMKPYLLIKS